MSIAVKIDLKKKFISSRNKKKSQIPDMQKINFCNEDIIVFEEKKIISLIQYIILSNVETLHIQIF